MDFALDASKIVSTAHFIGQEPYPINESLLRQTFREPTYLRCSDGQKLVIKIDITAINGTRNIRKVNIDTPKLKIIKPNIIFIEQNHYTGSYTKYAARVLRVCPIF